MILLINNGNDDRNISPFQAHRIMEELGVSVNVHSDSELWRKNKSWIKLKD